MLNLGSFAEGPYIFRSAHRFEGVSHCDAVGSAPSQSPAGATDLTPIINVLIKEVECRLWFAEVVAIGECGDVRMIEKKLQLALHGEIMPEQQ